MRKRFKWKLIAFLAVIASLFLLGGCDFQPSLEERRDKYGLTARVTYHSNGTGAYFGTPGSDVKTLDLPEGALAMNIGKDTVLNGSMPTPVRSNYTLVGWYEAQLDDEGNVKMDNGEVVLKNTPFDFSTRLQKGDEIVLYAKWQKNESIHVYLTCNEIDAPFMVKRGEENVVVENGGWLIDYPYAADGTRAEPTTSMYPSVTGYTLYDFYLDAECTEKVSWSSLRGDCNIYAKYIVGDWTFLKAANDVKKLFIANAKTNFYLRNDIDCTGLTGVKGVPNFNAVLEGNNFTISNLTIEAGTYTISDKTISMFGNMKENAALKNVTFDNITINGTLRPNIKVKVYALFESRVDATVIENVTLKRMNFTFECGADAFFTNMSDGSVWFVTHALFGGKANGQGNVDDSLNDSQQVNDGLDVDISEVQINVSINGENVLE